jgi:hypothetical protein
MRWPIPPETLQAGLELAVRRIGAQVRQLRLTESDTRAICEAEQDLQIAIANLVEFLAAIGDAAGNDTARPAPVLPDCLKSRSLPQALAETPTVH